MKIKLISSNSAEVLMDKRELDFCGVMAKGMTFRSYCSREMLQRIFDALEAFCGLNREGKFALVECHPYNNGGCRLEFLFSDEQSHRLYIFDSADDMLDAFNNLSYSEYFNTSHMNIQPVEGKFFVYILETAKISKHNLAILSEYRAQ